MLIRTIRKLIRRQPKPQQSNARARESSRRNADDYHKEATIASVREMHMLNPHTFMMEEITGRINTNPDYLAENNVTSFEDEELADTRTSMLIQYLQRNNIEKVSAFFVLDSSFNPSFEAHLPTHAALHLLFGARRYERIYDMMRQRNEIVPYEQITPLIMNETMPRSRSWRVIHKIINSEGNLTRVNSTAPNRLLVGESALESMKAVNFSTVELPGFRASCRLGSAPRIMELEYLCDLDEEFDIKDPFTGLTSDVNDMRLTESGSLPVIDNSTGDSSLNDPINFICKTSYSNLSNQFSTILMQLILTSIENHEISSSFKRIDTTIVVVPESGHQAMHTDGLLYADNIVGRIEVTKEGQINVIVAPVEMSAQSWVSDSKYDASGASNVVSSFMKNIAERLKIKNKTT